VIKSTEGLLSVYSCSLETHDEALFKNKTSQRNQISSKGIEVGHIFYFGTKYSEAFDANYINSNGEKKLIHSGSYGIGVSRLVAAIIEANNDDKGIIWPKQVTPYDLGLINVRSDNSKSKGYSEEFYKKFINKYEVIYDDREVRAGEKFNDMDLIGVPLQVIIGEKNLFNSNIEVKHRNTGKLELISLDKIESYLEKYCEH
jgi:prolyl-tRNA synthetase